MAGTDPVMSDIDTVRAALSWAANWLGMKFTPHHQEALEALDRLAARDGESEVAPKWPYGNPYIGDSALVPCRVEHFYPEEVSGHGDMVKLSIGSAEVIVPVSWVRPLPPSPETA